MSEPKVATDTAASPVAAGEEPLLQDVDDTGMPVFELDESDSHIGSFKLDESVPDVEVPRSKEENVIVAALKDLYRNQNAWRIFKGFLALLVALRVAHEFDFLPGSLAEYVPFTSMDFGAIKDFFNMN